MNLSLLIQGHPPFCFQPALAEAIGLNQAIVLQQLSYLLSRPGCGREINGEKWVFNTYEQWQREYFPFWSIPTIQRIFADLQERALIASCQPEGVMSRRKYYRLGAGCLSLTAERVNDAEELMNDEDIKKIRCGEHQIDMVRSVSICDLPITETSAETSTDTHTPKPASLDAEKETIYQAYPSKRRGGRKEAYKAIASALRDVSAADLLARVKAYAASSEVRQKARLGEWNFVPLLPTWLNKGRYDMDAETPPAGTPVKPTSLPEPSDWQARIDAEYPDCAFATGRAWYQPDWRRHTIENQRMIAEQLSS